MRKLTALESIRKLCLECEGGSPAQVADCLHPACPFYAYRFGESLPVGKHRPLKAIRTYCVEKCQAGCAGEVPDCQGNKAVLGPCPAFPFRMGKNPNITAETREKRKEHAHRLVAKGKIGGNMPVKLHSMPFQLPESTKTPQADLG